MPAIRDSIANPTVAAQFYETPFIYNKLYQQTYTDTAPITGTTGDFLDVIKSDGDSDFFARRALNLYNFNDQNGLAFISGLGGQTLASPPGLDYPIAPEKLYTLGADIPIQMSKNSGLILPSVAFLTFPLGGGHSAFANIACPLFQGVKRRNGVPNNDVNYRFREKPFTYVMEFTQDWTYFSNAASLRVASPRTLIKVVDSFDFELQALEFSADYWNTTESAYNGYLIKIYDQNGVGLMKDFVHYRHLSYNGGYNGTGVGPGNTLSWHPNCFPVPPVLFQKGANIQIDVISLLDTNTGGGGASIDQVIHLRGVRRIPC